FYLIQDSRANEIKASVENDAGPVMTARTPGVQRTDISYSAIRQDNSSFRVTDFAVSGRITDATDGSPVPGVNVLVKGTSSGTTSDSDGRYAVNAPDGDAVLIFSFIGYQTQEIPVIRDQSLTLASRRMHRSCRRLWLSAMVQFRRKTSPGQSRLSTTNSLCNAAPSILLRPCRARWPELTSQ